MIPWIKDTYVEDVDGGIVIKFKKFLVEEGGNEISVSGTQNFIYAFSDTVGEGNGANRGKAGIDLSTGEVQAQPEKWNDIILDSDGKIRMQYVVSDPDPDAKLYFRRNSIYSSTLLLYPAEIRFSMPPENGKGTKSNAKGISYLPALQLI